MTDTNEQFKVDLGAVASSLWFALLEQPCPAGITTSVMDHTVRAGP